MVVMAIGRAKRGSFQKRFPLVKSISPKGCLAIGLIRVFFIKQQYYDDLLQKTISNVFKKRFHYHFIKVKRKHGY
jgi:hypothetical protein